MSRTLALITAALLLLGACSSDGDAKSTAADETPSSVVGTPSATDSEVSVPSPSATPTKKPKPPAPLYPKGYPKVVSVASLPDQVRSWYKMSDQSTKAVAIAPGVWTELPPGASMQDAAASEVYDGFCASIKAYSRKYRHGQEFAGTCW